MSGRRSTRQRRAPCVDQKICPCSLPALVPNTEVIDDPARAPYWTLPVDLGGETIALTSDLWGTASLRDCAGAISSLFGKGLLARLDSTRGVVRPGAAGGGGDQSVRIGALRRRHALPTLGRLRAQLPLRDADDSRARGGRRIYFRDRPPLPVARLGRRRDLRQLRLRPGELSAPGPRRRGGGVRQVLRAAALLRTWPPPSSGRAWSRERFGFWE